MKGGRLLFLALLPCCSAFASDDAVLGGYAGGLDRMGAGVRELGRGNTGTALLDAGPAAYWNPALLPFERDPQAGVGTEALAADRTAGYVFFQERLTGSLGVGFGVINRGDVYGFTAYDQDENVAGTVHPEDFASYIGIGMRTSRQNGFGVTVQWYTSNLDVGGGIGNIDYVGGLNLGWYHRFPDSLSVAVVLRNLGLNDHLSAEYSQSIITDQSNAGFENTQTDFFPKTLVVAGEWRKSLFQRSWNFSAEVMDYQLDNVLFTPNPAFHTQDFRLGAECEIAPHAQVRIGDDRGDLDVGFGYAFPWHRRQLLQFDYAVVMERLLTSTGFETIFFDPFAIGLKTTF